MPSRSPSVLLMLGYHVREIHHGVAAFAHEAGWRLDASMTHFGIVPEDWHGDGIITFSSDRPDIIAKVGNEPVPCVEMFNGNQLAATAHVLIDNLAIGRMAGEYLVSLGLLEMGYFFYDPALANKRNEEERSRGIEEAAGKAGRRFHRVPFANALATIRGLPKPLGLLTQNDLVGSELIHLLLDGGIRVPQEVAVVGVDSDWLYQTCCPVSQTVVKSNLEYQGYAAAELLQRLMRGEPPPAEPVMIPPVRVIERASTSSLGAGHPAVEQALKFIREHLCEGIEAEHVAVHAGLSRYQIDAMFKRHAGESLSRYLMRVRLDRARALLAETDDKIHALALDLGFRSATYFTTVFQQATGITPGEFRKRTRVRVQGFTE